MAVDFLLRRRQKLQKRLKEAGLDAMLVSNPLNVTYLTGFTGDSSYVVITAKKIILVSDQRFTIQIRDECPELETSIRGADRSTEQEVVDVLGKLKPHSVAIEATHLTVATLGFFSDALPSLAWNSTKFWLEEHRAIKDANEILATREAVRMAEAAYKMFRVMLKETDSELDLVQAMESYIHRVGGSGPAFPLIMGIGERSALPHAPPTKKTLAGEEFLLVDWGVCGGLYRSDLTRVFRSPFAPSLHSAKARLRVENKLQKIYTVVLQAQTNAIATIRPGVSVTEIDRAARSVINDAGYGPLFNHGLGHGIGLQTHELPRIRGNSTDVLQEGMIITMEPGIYIEGFAGVRIEDDILVTSEGCEVLSKLPKQWDEIWDAVG